MSFASLFRLIASLFAPKPKLVLLGDSYLANLATTGQQQQLREPFKTALNLAVHGNTTGQIMQRISQIPAGVPVLLEGGINDISLNVENGIIPNYTYMLSRIPTSNKVILLGMARIDETIGNGAEVNAKTKAYNAEINALAAQRPNTVVALTAQDMSMVGLTIDGAHPAPAGYVALVNALAGII